MYQKIQSIKKYLFYLRKRTKAAAASQVSWEFSERFDYRSFQCWLKSLRVICKQYTTNSTSFFAKPMLNEIYVSTHNLRLPCNSITYSKKIFRKYLGGTYHPKPKVNESKKSNRLLLYFIRTLVKIHENKTFRIPNIIDRESIVEKQIGI